MKIIKNENDGKAKDEIKLVQYNDNEYNYIYDVKKKSYQKYVEDYWGVWDEQEQKNRYKKSMEKTKDFTYIIVWNEKKVGFYQGELIDDTYYIENICITPKYRGKGIGTTILTDIMDKYKNKDIRIQYFKQNPAGKLYERLGFLPDGETVFHYQMIKPKQDEQ